MVDARPVLRVCSAFRAPHMGNVNIFRPTPKKTIQFWFKSASCSFFAFQGVRGQEFPSARPWKFRYSHSIVDHLGIGYFHSTVVHLGRSTCQGRALVCARGLLCVCRVRFGPYSLISSDEHGDHGHCAGTVSAETDNPLLSIEINETNLGIRAGFAARVQGALRALARPSPHRPSPATDKQESSLNWALTRDNLYGASTRENL